MGLEGPCEYVEPLPSYDHCGYDMAVQTLLHSKLTWTNVPDHTQYDTVRKNRTTHSNYDRSLPQENFRTMTVGDSKQITKDLVKICVDLIGFTVSILG